MTNSRSGPKDWKPSLSISYNSLMMFARSLFPIKKTIVDELLDTPGLNTVFVEIIVARDFQGSCVSANGIYSIVYMFRFSGIWRLDSLVHFLFEKFGVINVFRIWQRVKPSAVSMAFDSGELPLFLFFLRRKIATIGPYLCNVCGLCFRDLKWGDEPWCG